MSYFRMMVPESHFGRQLARLSVEDIEQEGTLHVYHLLLQRFKSKHSVKYTLGYRKIAAALFGEEVTCILWEKHIHIPILLSAFSELPTR